MRCICFLNYDYTSSFLKYINDLKLKYVCKFIETYIYIMHHHHRSENASSLLSLSLLLSLLSLSLLSLSISLSFLLRFDLRLVLSGDLSTRLRRDCRSFVDVSNCLCDFIIVIKSGKSSSVWNSGISLYSLPNDFRLMLR